MAPKTHRSDQRPLVPNPNDISNLLFPDNTKDNNVDVASATPYVGPVKVAFLSTTREPRQRGLFAMRDIEAGELLFVTLPTVEASVATVMERWNRRRHQPSTTDKNNDKSEALTRTLLEECSEEVLLEAMSEALERKDNMLVADSFTCLTGASQSQADLIPSMNRLNAILDDDKDNNPSNDNAQQDDPSSSWSKDDLLKIIRQNAFGPDGLYSYTNMEQAMIRSSSLSLSNVASPPPRLLGLYPLAAMINHSCLANAVRIFCGGSGNNSNNLMVVHALKKLNKGDEIVWGYIPPTQPYAIRQATLAQHYQFHCQCSRCQMEEKEVFGEEAPQMIRDLLSQHPCLEYQHSTNTSTQQQQQQRDLLQVPQAIRILEHDVLTKKFLSNTVKGYLRIAYLPVYTRYLNLSTNNKSTAERAGLLPMVMNLHLSCATSHYASTEHLAILHWCYQTVGQMHSISPEPSKVRFWTEQLKKAHMVRYGALGQDLETVRRVMKETRGIVMATEAAQAAGGTTPSLLL